MKIAFAAIVALAALTACNTVTGIGKDVSAAGHAISGVFAPEAPK